MKVVLFLALLACVKGDVESCKNLKHVYEAFDCVPSVVDPVTNEPTEYCCTNSSYILNYKKNSCYFQGKTYEKNEVVATPYPNIEGTALCYFICRGGYFDFEVVPDVVPPPKTACTTSLLYSQDQFNGYQAPIFDNNSENVICPYRWTAGDGSDGAFPSAPCQDKEHCCKLMGRNIPIGETVKFPGQEITCYCGCPPLMYCFPSEHPHISELV